MAITKLSEIIYPITEVNKVNEIVDTLNDNLGMYYSEYNPELTPVDGTASWVVTHNLGTKNISCCLFDEDDIVVSKISITSDNSITVYINATSTISEDTYKIIVVANGETSATAGGLEIDSTLSSTSTNPVQNKVITNALSTKFDKANIDSTLSATSTNPVQNKVLFPTFSNFKYSGGAVIITVSQDGTGNFTNIYDAILSVHNKYCDSCVHLAVKAGTYEIPQTIGVNGRARNCPFIKIDKSGDGEVILVGSDNFSGNRMFNIEEKQMLWFSNLTFRQGNSPIIEAIRSRTGSSVFIENCTFDGFTMDHVYCQGTGMVQFRGTCNFKNFTNQAIMCEAGSIDSAGGSVLNFVNNTSVSTGTAFCVTHGGQIHVGDSNTVNLTKVKYRANISIGTPVNTGWITGA